MKLTPLLIPALLLLGGAATVTTAEVLAFSVVDEEFDTLNAAYEASVEEWKASLDGASKEERRKLRKTKPAASYWDRFVALSDKGNGQAKFWLISNIRQSSVKSSKRDETIKPLYEALVAKHVNADWFAGVVEQVSRDKRTLGDEMTLRLYETVIKTTESDENRAAALYEAGVWLKRSDDEKLQERGAAYHARVDAEFGETPWGAKVREKLAAEKVQVGKMAPDFTGKTIDGFEFNLSDYKGKVVVLDFYGFW